MSDTTIVRNQMTRRSFAGPGKPARARSGSPRPGEARSSATADEIAVAERLFKMPSVEDVIAAGYPAERWNEIKKERDRIMRQFLTDPAFRAEVLEDSRLRPYPDTGVPGGG